MDGESKHADWIAVDWGTSNLRAWAIREGAAVAEAASGKGMGVLAPGAFEPALLEIIGPWLGGEPVRVVASGMVGARQGWQEAPYVVVPCAPTGTRAVRPDVADPRLDVTILPGLAQDKPADVMRGEETQIAGYLAGDPGFDGIICLPGTHTKWVLVSAGEVVSFRTFMTGELFALLSTASVLRHSVGEGWDDDAFAEAVNDAMGKPEAIAARLFALRAETLLADLGEGTATARLSGLLIGAELAAARAYWLGQRIVLVGEGRQVSHYARALASCGAMAETADATTVTLAGLAAAHARLQEKP
ncbi:MAG: 2-dehydro-3-deoxygalactonokinase [Boseongicola sp. SB0673_bin_14]|nr:2-dehydro-3-deoxygalactonokinase [Boseongicola sp. SB0667_bin_21]MYI68517.1 2-dehydro-3-deoxygalactonokinase [Boseongicola sp. SB0673_bin_14]